jgi:formylglycine-generating enzyme required for sulfatase activity
MKAQSSFLIIATLVLLAAWGICIARAGKPPELKPWERQGTKAGDEIIGPDGGTMVWVPPGEFDMGSKDGPPAEQPLHHVRIVKGFWLRKCTVTNASYRRYCQETGADFPAMSDQGDGYPVVCVDWKAAQAYCSHYGLSLPTEAQWEYAARGPEGRTYPWGNDWDPSRCCNWSYRGPSNKTFPVASFPQSASWCGALDMAGNVWQWCNDWYDSKYYAHWPDADPPGPDEGELLPVVGQCRVLRGGSWSNDDPGDFRSAHRWYVENPQSRRDVYGFRCARTP